MLRKMIKRVLFGKKKNYYRKNKMSYKYVNWYAYHKLECRLDNLLKHLKLRRIGNHSLIGDDKDGDKFKDQFDY
jgi:hypothetical protein